ncbi:putative protein kinase RLK-Pelle-WAK family [Helianthus annuus]|nr:putative protein kinase RLK-Pelle-WAK family [Helianthus annuus]
MVNNGSVVTGCSSACLSNITVGDRNSCFGTGCCQIAIPHYVKSYNISLMGGLGVHGGCGSAFLVEDESLYEQGRFSDTFKFKNSSFIPVSLLWTLTDSDHVTCCFDDSPFRRKVNMFNGNSLDTLKCSYYTRLSLKDNPYLTDGCEGYEEETAKYAKTGCKEMCGNVTIPFPFGIGASCSVNRWYIVDCKNSTPYLRALNNLKVLSVDLESHTIIVSTPRITDCQNPIRNSSEIMGVNLGLSPFLFSKTHNKFVFEGCGIASMMDNGNVLTACTTTCHGVTLSDRNNCFGIGCCQTTIPHYLKSYTISLTGLDEESGGSCGSAFLVDETSYEEGNFSIRNTSFIPVSLMWTLRDSDQVTCCYDRTLIISKVDILNDTIYTWNCSDSYYSTRETGNPYLADGCIYTSDPVTEDCKRCEDRGGYCMRDEILDVDGLVFSQKYNCYFDEKRTSLSVILGVSISMGVLFIIAISYLLYKVIKKTKEKRRRKRFFKRNGGLLLKQQEEADPSLVDKTIHFTSRELQKATDNFNENRILGRGGQGTVYKGMLVDGRIVAVKKSKIVDESQLEQFINEVVVLSQINHRNVVKLLGCCLETDVPLLVSEFIPNGTLYDRLHNETDELSISFDMRLQIATEVAAALAYLHSATSIPIYHRDIKTTNILLDDKYRAKVSDFGTSRFVSIDQTHLTTLVKGTFGYFDPEYFQSSQFTEKSDVYSFGVVLAELLTGERPISLTRFGENRNLAAHFMLAMEEGRVMSIFDATVIKEGNRDELLIVANLAMRCLNMNGKYRPTMKEVAIELETIRRSHIPSIIQTNTSSMAYGEELSMLRNDESSSTFLSFSDSIN